ncbi:MAG: hypothetical protein HY791_12600 [Deltaproteobacteria bacterium]|nr:hypothetical protein [Deltaproteobacteria bacterium]
MPVLPGRTLLVALLVPIGLSAAAIADPSLVSYVFAADAAFLLVAILDLGFVAGRPLSIRRRAPRVASLGRTFEVELELESRARFPLSLRLMIDVDPAALASDSPAEPRELEPLALEVPTAGRIRTRVELRPTRRGRVELGDHFVRFASPGGFWVRQQRIAARDSIRVVPDSSKGRAAELTEPSTTQTIVMIDLEDRRAFDSMLTTAACLAESCARRSMPCGLVAFAGQTKRVVAPRAGRAAKLRLLSAIAELNSVDEPVSFEAGFASARGLVRSHSILLVLTHVDDDATLEELVEQARSAARAHSLIVALIRDPEVAELALLEGMDAHTASLARCASDVVASWRRAALALERAGVMVLEVNPDQLTESFLNALSSVASARNEDSSEYGPDSARARPEIDDRSMMGS